MYWLCLHQLELFVCLFFVCLFVFCFFFFKQKTAYEIGTGDWSSDVCSSDLLKRVSDSVESIFVLTFAGERVFGAGHGSGSKAGARIASALNLEFFTES